MYSFGGYYKIILMVGGRGGEGNIHGVGLLCL